MLTSLRTVTIAIFVLFCGSTLAIAKQTNRTLVALQLGNWHAATHAILTEARDSGNSLSLPAQLATAGFLTDAIQSAEMLRGTSLQAEALVELVLAAPKIGRTEQRRLIEAAQTKLRVNSTFPWTSSGTLAEIALIYSTWGIDSKAHAIFDNGVHAAESGIAQANSPGFAFIAQALEHATPSSVQNWMVGSVLDAMEHFRQSPESVALTYLSLAQTQFNRGDIRSALALSQRTWDTTRSLPNFGQAEAIRSSISEAALDANQIEFAKQHADKSPVVAAAYARYEARVGHLQTTLEDLKQLQGPTLYVDVRGQTVREIVRDAARRQDFASASFFASHSDAWSPALRLELWATIANSEWNAGRSTQSRADFTKALSIADSVPVNERPSYAAVYDVLAERMASSGLHDEAIRLAQSTEGSINALSDKQLVRKIRETLLLATALHAAGAQDEAKSALTRAYQMAHTYQLHSEFDVPKPDLLMNVATVTASFQ